MSSKTMVRFFTIADFEEEEIWLRHQHKEGWKLKKMIVPCFFIFESCPPEDVVYRLDFKNGTEDGDYFQIFRDYGWEYCARCTGWLYFRKPLFGMEEDRDTEIFSDDRTRMEMVTRIVKTRILPLCILFFCAILPGFFRTMSGGPPFLFGVYVILMILYILIFSYCGLKFRKMQMQYKRE